ncbi:hypothetical protein ONZ45_g2645 [Pleurotus djamor]|nr:hypothetical protein ONZ45_g2645 [Pleurotus djamor]
MPATLSFPSALFLIFAGAIPLYFANKPRKPPLPPGPPANPVLGHLRIFPMHHVEEVLHEWSQQYGDVMSFRLPGRNIIVLSSHDAAVELLQKRSALYSCRPDMVVYELMGWVPDLALMPYGQRFRKQRKLLGPALSQKACIPFRPMQHENALLLVHELLKDGGENLDRVLSKFTTSVVMRIAIGHQVLSDDDEFVKIASDVGRAMNEGGVPGITAVDWFPFRQPLFSVCSIASHKPKPTVQYMPSWFPGTHYVSVARHWRWAIRRLFDYPFEFVRTRMEEGTSSVSFLSKHLDVVDLANLSTDDIEDLKGAAALIYSGGAETIARNLRQDEIDRVIGEDRLPSFEDRESLPYVTSLVWGRIVPLGVPHRSTHDDIYRGMFIPKGSLVCANIYGMSLNNDTYKNPSMFNPKRFLSKSQGGDGEPVFWDVFGFGRRICPGRHLALETLWIAITTLLSALQIDRAKNASGEEIIPVMEYDAGVASGLSLIIAGSIPLYFVNKSRKLPLPPGPPTDPLIGHLRIFPTKDQEVVLYEWSRKYGDVMSFRLPGQTIIVLNSHEAAVELLEKRSALYSCRPNIVVYKLMGWEPDVVLMPYGSRFRKHRKLLGSALSQKACESFRELQRDNTLLLVDQLLEDGEDFDQHLNKFTTAVILRIAIGHQVLSDDDEFVKITSDVGQALNEGGLPGGTVVDWLPFLQHMPTWFPGTHYVGVAQRWKWAIRRLYDYPFDYVRRKIDGGFSTPSFLSNHLQSVNIEELDGDDIEDLKGATALMYVGGAETTWSALANFILAMTLHPECQRLAQEEIDRVVGQDRLPSFEDRGSLPYVTSIVQETLRWGRVIPLGIPHRSTQDDIYRDMGGDGEPVFWDAFGFGRRICPGRHLAIESLWIAITTILAALNINRARNEHGDEIIPIMEYNAGITSHLKPFRCEIAPRTSGGGAKLVREAARIIREGA